MLFDLGACCDCGSSPIFSPCKIGGCDAPDAALRVALYSMWVDNSLGSNPRWELCFEATLPKVATPYPLKTYTATPVDRGIDVYWDHLDQDITVAGGWSGPTYTGDRQLTIRLYLGCPNGKGTYGGSPYTILMGGKGPANSWTSVAAQPVPFNGNTTRIPPPAGGCNPYNVVQTSVPDETTIAFWAAGNAYYIQVQPADSAPLDLAEPAPALLATQADEPAPSALDEFFANLAEIKSCPHFSRPDGCGCDFGRCGKYDRPTSYRECLDCGLWSRG